MPGAITAASAKYLSPAKLNLFLKVTGKRPDGYHEIHSLFQAITLYDEIDIKIGPGNRITMSCDSPVVPDDKSNLAFRAAESFLSATGLKAKVAINLKKRIPVGAGLGGGSSNAATVLLALNFLTNSGLSKAELMRIGATLGSDVPFFIFGPSAVARGRGEVLTGAKLPSYWYVLVNPGFHVSTAWVYNNLDLTKPGEDNIVSYSEEVFRDPDKLKKILSNDLERVTLGRHPELEDLKKALLESGAFGALMSGSGPTVFGAFSSERKARSAFEKLREKSGGKTAVFLARGLDGPPGADDGA